MFTVEPAKFVKKLNNLSVEKGKPLILECTYSGTPPIAVLWKKNGFEVAHSEKCSITTTETSAILEVPSSKIEDQGQYTCHIENDSGRDLCQADISVLEPPYFVTRLEPAQVTVGDSAVSGSPPISVAWFQDGNEIVSGDKYEVSFSDNMCGLKLNALDSSDAGPYTCAAANAAGSDECSRAKVPQAKCFLDLLLFLPWQFSDIHFCHGQGHKSAEI
uniref:Ig-like domain-containing protein n=1 Tax=Gopherus agassizii TaxID=38772 RepID=A0A452HGM1_9SAUR